MPERGARAGGPHRACSPPEPGERKAQWWQDPEMRRSGESQCKACPEHQKHQPEQDGQEPHGGEDSGSDPRVLECSPCGVESTCIRETRHRDAERLPLVDREEGDQREQPDRQKDGSIEGVIIPSHAAGEVRDESCTDYRAHSPHARRLFPSRRTSKQDEVGKENRCSRATPRPRTHEVTGAGHRTFTPTPRSGHRGGPLHEVACPPVAINACAGRETTPNARCVNAAGGRSCRRCRRPSGNPG